MSWACDLEDGPAVYSWTEPIARKIYICCECRDPISIGQQYFKAQGLWEGGWSTFRQHLLCLDACMYARDNFESGECIAFSGLKEYYQDVKGYLHLHKKEEKVKRFRQMMARILVCGDPPGCIA